MKTSSVKDTAGLSSPNKSRGTKMLCIIHKYGFLQFKNVMEICIWNRIWIQSPPESISSARYVESSAKNIAEITHVDDKSPTFSRPSFWSFAAYNQKSSYRSDPSSVDARPSGLGSREPGAGRRECSVANSNMITVRVYSFNCASTCRVRTFTCPRCAHVHAFVGGKVPINFHIVIAAAVIWALITECFDTFWKFVILPHVPDVYETGFYTNHNPCCWEK